MNLYVFNWKPWKEEVWEWVCGRKMSLSRENWFSRADAKNKKLEDAIGLNDCIDAGEVRFHLKYCSDTCSLFTYGIAINSIVPLFRMWPALYTYAISVTHPIRLFFPFKENVLHNPVTDRRRIDYIPFDSKFNEF